MVKRLTGALKRHGYKLTRQRQSILKVISASRSHLTPAEIYQMASREDASVGLVTVYRTLEILARYGLICKVHTGGLSQSFLVRRYEVHHHHLVCSSCGNVVDFTDCNLDELEKKLSRKTGFNIEGHLLELHGRCPDCYKDKSAT
jgi:Fur family ferric uptake transcriptional regulator